MSEVQKTCSNYPYFLIHRCYVSKILNVVALQDLQIKEERSTNHNEGTG
jgi:hypothetical protein